MKFRITSKALVAFFLLGSLLAVAAQEKDWIKTSTKDGAITFLVPPGYIADDPNDPQAKANLEKIKENNPKLAKAMGSGLANDEQTLQMYDLNDSPDDGLLDSFNVITKKNPGINESHLGEVGKQVLASMPWKGKGEQKVIKLPFGKACNYWGSMEVKLPDGAMRSMDLVGFLFLKGDKLHVVTFATGEGQLKQKRELFEKILKSAKF